MGGSNELSEDFWEVWDVNDETMASALIIAKPEQAIVVSGRFIFEKTFGFGKLNIVVAARIIVGTCGDGADKPSSSVGW